MSLERDLLHRLPWVGRKISSGTASRADQNAGDMRKDCSCLGRVAPDPATHTGAFSTILSRSRTSQNIQVRDGSDRHGQDGGAGGAFRQVCLALEINDQIESFSRLCRSSICPKASALWLCKGLVNLSANGAQLRDGGLIVLQR